MRHASRDFRYEDTGVPHADVLFSGTCTIDTGWRHALWDPFWRYYCNLDAGAVVQNPDGGLVPLAPGAVVLVPPWTRCTGTCRNRVRHAFLTFNLVGVGSGWMRHAFPGAVPAGRIADWTGAFAALPLRPATPLGERLAAQARICAALAVAVAALPASIQAEADRMPAAHPTIAPALEEIERNYQRRLTVAGLAHRCGCTPDHLARRFRAAIGQTPHAWLRQRRVMAAAELLLQGRSVEETAGATGFSDRYRFSRAFSAVMGRPPVVYRTRGGM